MKKIKNLCKQFSEKSWWLKLIAIFFFIMAAFSIGVQSLLIWIGGLFPSVENLGLKMDAILGVILVLPPLIGASFAKHKGNGSILVGLLAIIGIYVSVVWYYHVGILVGCLVLLYACMWRLNKIGDDPLWIFGGACAYLLYSVGAYVAMIFNGLEPAIDGNGVIVLAIMTFCTWFILVPASEPEF